MKTLAATILLTISFCYVGIADFRMNFTVSDYVTFKSKYNLHGFASVQAYFGALIPNYQANMEHAWAAGYNHVDIVITPCHFDDCSNPEMIVNKVLDSLEGENFQMFWISLNSDHFSTDVEYNRKFILRMIEMIDNDKRDVGIRSWQGDSYSKIFGNWHGLKNYPLWYISYNNVASFDDFVSFGGWVKPTMKSFQQIAQTSDAFADIFYY